MTTLPIGAFMIREEVDKLVAERNCQVIEDAGQGRRRAVACGINKINVNTECQLVFAAATREYIEAGKDQQGKGFDPRKLLAPGAAAIKETVKEKMELFCVEQYGEHLPGQDSCTTSQPELLM